MQADLIVVNGCIETMDERGTVAEAAAIVQGHFVAVGNRAVVEQLSGPRTGRVDLTGGTLLPGFIDTHMHLEKIVRELAMVHLEEAHCLADVVAAVAKTAAQTPAGEWIQSFGDDGAWHERQLAEFVLPDRTALDQVAPSQPVFLFRGPDTAVLNSLAVEALASSLENAPAGEWDPERGLWCSPHLKKVQQRLPGPDRDRALHVLYDGCRKLLRMGITSVVDPGLPARFAESWEFYQAAYKQRLFPQRTYLMNRFDYHRPFDQEFDRLLGSPALPMDGDDHLRAWAVKLILDGEFVDAWMRPDEPSGGASARRYSREELDSVLDLCSDRGWPLCIHTMGGGATDFVIDGVRRAKLRGVSLSAGQVSLAHVFFPTHASLESCRALGIFLSVHPLLAYVFEREMQSTWGAFACQAMPLAAALASGAGTAGGSDVLPCEPLRGAYMSVARTCRHGFPLDPSQAISPREALLLFTRYAGSYMGRQDLGVIAPGCVADFAVWPVNPLYVSPEQWPDLRADLVAIDGQIVWPPR